MDDELNDFGYPEWTPQPEEIDRDRLNHVNPPRRIRWSFRQRIDPVQLAEELAKRLDHASHVLVDRLFSYLANIPNDASQQRNRIGLTLPASAIGWLSTQMYPRSNENDSLLESHSEAAWMGASMRDRLALLKYLMPRATHLRITLDEWPPPLPKKKSSNLSTDFTGRDLDLSNISVHSGVTMETSVNLATSPIEQSFLLFYNQIKNKPRLDMKVFPNLAVLFLDGIPPEWVVNLRALHNKIKLIRCERGGIFDMSRFLFGDDDDDQGDTSPPYSCVLSSLRYLKVNHAALGELSGLRRTCRNRRVMSTSAQGDNDTSVTMIRPPPLSRLSNLVSLSLAHNEIRTIKTALAGLASLSNLTFLDLSHNRITTMKGSNRLLGNINTLMLTGNLLTNVVGMEKLYSIETLYLDHNNIGDVADIAGLGKLPELMALFVDGNPLIEKDPIRYRVNVLDLFKSTRFYSLLPGATYRQLLQLLPVLDGVPATKRELVGLKSLTFRPAQLPVVTQWDKGNNGTTQEPQTACVSSVQSALVPEPCQLTPTDHSRRVTRKVRRRRAVLSEREVEALPPGPPQALRSNRSDLPIVEFSTKDVIESLALLTEITTSEKKKKLGTIALSAHHQQENVSFISFPSNSNHLTNAKVGTLSNEMQTVVDGEDFDCDFPNLLDNYTVASYVRQPNDDCVSTPSAADQAESKALTRDDPVDIQLNVLPNVEAKHDSSITRFSTAKVAAFEGTPSRGSSLHGQSNPINPFDEESPLVNGSPYRPAENNLSASLTDMDFLPRACVAFPEGLWDDSASHGSSIETALQSVDAIASEFKNREAEKMSVYDGPDGYKKLSVVVNLELYFKLFVFPSTSSHVNVSHNLDDEFFKIASEVAPRIQLRPVDRKVAEEAIKTALGSAKLLALRESFMKVWQEEVIACGRSATRRLTPHKKLRRGFHGDPVFRDGSISFVAECRKIILCTSDAAMYLIPDYDAVSMRFIESSRERKFPSPIPHEALFQNGPWPHALARLPIETLRRITIGFGFQRLILHFVPSSAIERSVMGNAQTFILATSNRLVTVKLLQHLQDLTKFTDDLSSGKQLHDLVIDNEDKQVLDALSVAVAPCATDVVLHYQVLQQRWNRGDRGTVRRACVITDSHIFLLDEDYVGDGSESYDGGSRTLGEVRYNLIDSAELNDIIEVQAARVDPREITIIIRPRSSFQRNHNWRLLCRDSGGAERLVDDARKAMESVTQEISI